MLCDSYVTINDSGIDFPHNRENLDEENYNIVDKNKETYIHIGDTETASLHVHFRNHRYTVQNGGRIIK